MLKPGLYELLLNEALRHAVDESGLLPEIEPVDRPELARVLAAYIARLAEDRLAGLRAASDPSEALAFANRVVGEICRHDADQSDYLIPNDDLLLSLRRSNVIPMIRPQISAAKSSLFTGARDEPQLYDEFKKELASCDRVDMLVSFIRWSGLRLILDDLRRFTERGGELRVVTTTYMGATDPKAVQALSELPNASVRVSYDTKHTRLHAKMYRFHRATGFSVAYVGSSNLSRAAMSEGLEWNVKITKKDQPEVYEKIAATFESYWNSDQFEPYENGGLAKLSEAVRSEGKGSVRGGMLFDIRPYAFQRRILEALETERDVRGHFRNLVVAATGTGKTVIAAFDYLRFRKGRKTARLLFIAHREELLVQALETFRVVLRDPNFGDLYRGQGESLDHLFLSIQMFRSRAFHESTPPDFYDYIVVDEFHHAAAPGYRTLLEYYRPAVFLGLTATPERMDGLDVTAFFGGRIAAEIRLPEAIEKRLLCPFQYFGVSDTVDLDHVRWSRGGYDRAELSNLYTLSGAVARRRADHVIQSIDRYTASLDEICGLGFCVSVEHARFMAEHFNARGIPSLALSAASSDDERYSAKTRLESGDLRFLFVVDLYNEGVDIPAVNTVLFLRPTESLTVFLQQLGRGLRLHEGKDCLTVLDFVGCANRSYDFEARFSALLRVPKSVEKEIQNGFPSLPAGCYIRLEKKASEIILKNIRSAIRNRPAILQKIADYQTAYRHAPALREFVAEYNISPDRIYRTKQTFARLSIEAGALPDRVMPDEDRFARFFRSLLKTDSRRFLAFLRRALTEDASFETPLETRMLRMLLFSVYTNPQKDSYDVPTLALDRLRACPPLRDELLELIDIAYDAIDFVDKPVDLGFDCPLDLHCTYTRGQIMAALDMTSPQASREGVLHIREKKLDAFFITLNKSEKDYSPSTMYHDYSLSPTLFHWQSQSTTSETSDTGRRYINHAKTGNRVILFVRESNRDPLTGEAAPYTYLGTASYSSHEGSKPMSILWRLDEPIPAKYLPRTNAMLGS